MGKNKYLQGKIQNSVREKFGKGQTWDILPYLKVYFIVIIIGSYSIVRRF